MGRRGPGLLGTAARTAVVAGTATAVSGNVRRRQAASAQQAAEQQQAAAQQQAVQAQTQAPAEDTIGKLERLAKLREQGVLTEQEFGAQKARILGT